MDALDWSGVVAIGLAAGMAGGLVGVGGGVLFVPALVVFADESQLGAEATSLVAIGLVVGVLSPLGVLVGVFLSNAVSERALELSFAGVQLAFAWQLAKKAGLR